MIKGKVGVGAVSIVPPQKGKGKKRAGDNDLQKEALKDFKIEYSKSGRAMCRGCELKILKDEVSLCLFTKWNICYVLLLNYNLIWYFVHSTLKSSDWDWYI